MRPREWPRWLDHTLMPPSFPWTPPWRTSLRTRDLQTSCSRPTPTRTGAEHQRRHRKKYSYESLFTINFCSVFTLRFIEELTKELRSKEALITELCGEKTMLTHRVGELEEQVQELSSSLLQKDKDVEVNSVFPSNEICLTSRNPCRFWVGI